MQPPASATALSDTDAVHCPFTLSCELEVGTVSFRASMSKVVNVVTEQGSKKGEASSGVHISGKYCSLEHDPLIGICVINVLVPPSLPLFSFSREDEIRNVDATCESNSSQKDRGKKETRKCPRALGSYVSLLGRVSKFASSPRTCPDTYRGDPRRTPILPVPSRCSFHGIVRHYTRQPAPSYHLTRAGCK